jgi:hypothetical protein
MVIWMVFMWRTMWNRYHIISHISLGRPTGICGRSVLREQPATALACQCGGSFGDGLYQICANRRLFQRRPATSTWAFLSAKLLKELKFQSRIGGAGPKFGT